MTSMPAKASVAPLARSVKFSDWDLYCFGLSLGLRTLPIAPVEGLKRLILPVEYIRCAESRYVLEHLEVAPDHVVLDIGSPKLLSLFLASRIGCQVYATDLLDYFFAAYSIHADRVLGVRRDRYRMEAQDAQALRYPENMFDRIFSISAIEHIPHDGDGASMREIARVLKPGGVCCLTVPWSDTGYREDFKRRGDPDAYWTASNEELVFYQRSYDGEALERRILKGSGLQVMDSSFWGERNIAVERVLLSRKLPRLFRTVMLPAHFVLSRLFLTKLTAEERSRKKVACMTLRKPNPKD